jgi:hypothetical protein
VPPHSPTASNADQKCLFRTNATASRTAAHATVNPMHGPLPQRSKPANSGQLDDHPEISLLVSIGVLPSSSVEAGCYGAPDTAAYAAAACTALAVVRRVALEAMSKALL